MLSGCHSRLSAFAVVIAAAATATVLLGLVGSAHAATLQEQRVKAKDLAAQIAAFDARIAQAAQRYQRATMAVKAVRTQILLNQHLQRAGRHQFEEARKTLAERAVAMYKHADVTTLDALFSSSDFAELVDQLSMVKRVARSDRDVLHAVEAMQRKLSDRAAALTADRSTAERLVQARSAELASIRAGLAARRAVLAGVNATIKRLVAAAARSAPSPGPSVEPPSGGSGGGSGGSGGSGGGSGQWWPLIQQAAASQGINARGMYRLMMIESGGLSAVVGPGGYYGLYQYAPSTWKGSWNPYRRASITDGAAQIRATALALHLGYGHAWWDPSYSMAFSGN